MKNLKLLAASIGFAVLTVACQKELTFDKVLSAGEDGNISIHLQLPETFSATRSAATTSSARGGITNVDMEKYDIRYKLAVYSETGDMVIEPVIKTVDKYEEIAYNFRLTPNKKYNFVVWADFVKQGTTEDLHYNTEDFKNITCKDEPSKQLNDESRDAYYIAKTIRLGSDPINETLVLRRPFSKIRVVATDWNLVPVDTPNYFEVKYYGTDCKRFKSINLLSGESEGEALKELSAAETVTYESTIDKDVKNYALSYDSDKNNRTLVVDYLMTSKSEQTPIHLEFSAFKDGKGGTLVSKYDFKTNVPIERNYLTTLMGNFFTSVVSVRIRIQENFVEEYNNHNSWFAPQKLTIVEPAKTIEGSKTTYHIKTREEFAWISEHPEILSGDAIFSLEADIDMNGINWQPIGQRDGNYGGDTGTFEGNNHTLRNFSINGDGLYMASHWFTKQNQQEGIFGLWYGTIRNLNVENVTIYGLNGDKVQDADKHKKQAWFAGIIGYAGGGSIFENINATNIFIKGKSYSQNLGGLVGYSNPNCTFKNCSVKFVTFQTKGDQIGGLVGSLNSNTTVENCSTDHVSLRPQGLFFGNAFSGLIGEIEDATEVKIKNCKAPEHLEYLNQDGTVFDKFVPKNPLYGTSRAGGEPTIE